MELREKLQYLQEVEHEPAAERGRDDAGGGKVAEEGVEGDVGGRRERLAVHGQKDHPGGELGDLGDGVVLLAHRDRGEQTALVAGEEDIGPESLTGSINVLINLKEWNGLTFESYLEKRFTR